VDAVSTPSAPPTPASGRQRLAHVLAVWFGCGHVPIAPGTAGTVGAIPLYLLLRPYGPLAVFGAAVIVTVVGIWASGIVEQRLGKKDPQIVCIDEVAGVLLTWVAAPATWKGLVVGFVLFRLFDQWKPWPARPAERLGGGLGVMLDDVVAGVWGAVVLLGVRRLGWL
jgi:phosphatidylglycerophosphatase A